VTRCSGFLRAVSAPARVGRDGFNSTTPTRIRNRAHAILPPSGASLRLWLDMAGGCVSPQVTHRPSLLQRKERPRSATSPILCSLSTLRSRAPPSFGRCTGYCPDRPTPRPASTWHCERAATVHLRRSRKSPTMRSGAKLCSATDGRLGDARVRILFGRGARVHPGGGLTGFRGGFLRGARAPNSDGPPANRW
jgi:hypothetical protein